ncbi:MAG: DNA gyrase subunit A [Anaerolineae bacterium]|nr:DNA gyrase subunit A [Anaerolineae bacterium]
MFTERPDLSQVDPAIVAYIESLEAEIERLAGDKKATAESLLETTEPPTTFNVITISRNGLAKRTPRHLYSRQRRGGMGIFDLESADDDPPLLLAVADAGEELLLITTLGRVFKLPASRLPELPVRTRGQSLTGQLELKQGEKLALALPNRGGGYLNVITTTGQIRRLRHHFFGENMAQGNLIYDARALGAPAAACWSSGSGDVFIATRQGKAIRFAEDTIPFKGCLGIRLADDDAIAGLCAVTEASGVFLLTADGKGTIRQMAGFSANKAPGAGGKVAIKAEDVVGAVTITPGDDIFAISRLSKIIRFTADEVPPKEGVVQGVNCMALRADETVALAAGRVANEG